MGLYSWQTNSFEDLRASIIREFPALGEYFAISYFDEEGDSIKVTSEPEFEEALNYAKQSECFLPIIIVEEEAPVPEEAPVAPEEPESPAFNAQDLFSRLCEFPSADNESVASNPFFRAIAEGANLPQEIEQAAQNFLPMLSPFVESIKNDLFAALQEEENRDAPVAVEAPVPASIPASGAECFPVDNVKLEVFWEKPGDAVHAAICDSCKANIRGIRYKCLICPDYDLCEVCEATNLNKHTHDANHVFAKIRDPAQRNSPIFRQQGRPLFRGGCGRGKFGGRRRVEKLENDVAALQEQVAALIAKRQEAEKEVPAPAPVDEGVVIEDVPEEEVSSDISVNIQPMVEEPMTLLQSMGFADQETNLAVLTAHNNNVEQA